MKKLYTYPDPRTIRYGSRETVYNASVTVSHDIVPDIGFRTPSLYVSVRPTGELANRTTAMSRNWKCRHISAAYVSVVQAVGLYRKHHVDPLEEKIRHGVIRMLCTSWYFSVSEISVTEGFHMFRAF